ncbi:MAG: hypothetical protein ACJAZX_001561 [Rickettsiales bacterium]|jgi:hypothetical protein
MENFGLLKIKKIKTLGNYFTTNSSGQKVRVINLTQELRAFLHLNFNGTIVVCNCELSVC